MHAMREWDDGGERGGHDVRRLHVPWRELRVQHAQLLCLRPGHVFSGRQRDQLQQLPVRTGGAAAEQHDVPVVPAGAVRCWRALDGMLPVPAWLLCVWQRLSRVLAVRRQHVLGPLRSLVLALPERHVCCLRLLSLHSAGMPAGLHSERQRMHRLPARLVLCWQRFFVFAMLAWLLCGAAKQRCMLSVRRRHSCASEQQRAVRRLRFGLECVVQRQCAVHPVRCRLLCQPHRHADVRRLRWRVRGDQSWSCRLLACRGPVPELRTWRGIQRKRQQLRAVLAGNLLS